MKTSIFKIKIAIKLYQQYGLDRLSFSKEQEAIDALNETLNNNGIAFTMKVEENSKSFIDEAGVELAAIVPV